MKKLIVGLALVLSSILLIGCSIEFGVDSKKEKREINESIECSGLEKIKISTGISNVTIDSYEGEDIKIEGQLGEYIDEIKISQSGSTLSIEEKNINGTSNLFSFGVNFNNSNNSIYKILLPKSFNGEITLKAGIGEAEVKNLDLKSLDINGGTGEVIVDNVSFDNLDLKAGVGEFNLYLGERAGDVTIDGGVGEVTVEYEKVSGNLTYKGGVGSFRCKIPRNSPVYFKTSTGLGDCKIDAKTSDEETYKFDLKIGVGDIKVYN